MQASAILSWPTVALVTVAVFGSSGAPAATHTSVLQPDLLNAEALALSGDTAVVSGARNDDRGVVNVYVRREGNWDRQATLLAPLPGFSFGDSAAIDGDTLIVGAWDEDSGVGAAYVYQRSGEHWSVQERLTPDTAPAFAGFGVAVDLHGDRAVLGAPGGDAAYVFERSGTSWHQAARLAPAEPPGGDGDPVDFGRSVAIDGDTVVIGAPSSDDLATASGSAHVFVRSGGGWSLQARLKPARPGELDLFGDAVAVSGDTVLVGAFAASNPGRETGAAYLFERSGTAWNQQQKLAPRDRQRGDAFGVAVALQGSTALVASIGDWDEGFGAGSVYEYRQHGGRWTLQAKLHSNDAWANNFGQMLAMDGDTALVGGLNFGPQVPSAYVFSLRPEPLLQCPGDIDDDGLAELAVVHRGGEVEVKSQDGTAVGRFVFHGLTDLAATALVPDTDTNGAPELLAVDRAAGRAEVRDLLTGALLAEVTLNDYPTYVDARVIPDQNGNGIPELVSLAWRPVLGQVHDGLTGMSLGAFEFVSPFFNPRSLVVYPDLDGNGAPELTVLAENKSTLHADKVEFRDARDGTRLPDLWFGTAWTVLQHALVADLNGNGYDEFAVLRMRPAALRGARAPVSVVLRDPGSRREVGTAWFSIDHPPSRFFTLPDVNGNGADELVVFGRRWGYGNQRAVVKDSATGRAVQILYFDRHAPMQDMAVCPDLNGNGAAELALLGRRNVDGRLKVIIKDTLSGERLAVVWF